MAAVGFQQSHKSSINFSMSNEMSNDVDEDLSQRIEEFKHQNPEDVEELKKCIQDVLGEAEKTVQERIDKKTVSWCCHLLSFTRVTEHESSFHNHTPMKWLFQVEPRNFCCLLFLPRALSLARLQFSVNSNQFSLC